MDWLPNIDRIVLSGGSARTQGNIEYCEAGMLKDLLTGQTTDTGCTAGGPKGRNIHDLIRDALATAKSKMNGNERARYEFVVAQFNERFPRFPEEEVGTTFKECSDNVNQRYDEKKLEFVLETASASTQQNYQKSRSLLVGSPPPQSLHVVSTHHHAYSVASCFHDSFAPKAQYGIPEVHAYYVCELKNQSGGYDFHDETGPFTDTKDDSQRFYLRGGPFQPGIENKCLDDYTSIGKNCSDKGVNW